MRVVVGVDSFVLPGDPRIALEYAIQNRLVGMPRGWVYDVALVCRVHRVIVIPRQSDTSRVLESGAILTACVP